MLDYIPIQSHGKIKRINCFLAEEDLYGNLPSIWTII